MENELQSIAVVDRKVMMPMPDGVRLATDIYRPKNAAGKVPAIWVRTPYNFNFWDVQNGVPRRHERAADRGQARLRLRRAERARPLLLRRQLRHPRHPKTDGFNTVDWLTKQPWSNGKVGTTGCSSTAEYQMGVAALGHPGYAAMNVQGFGAGVGRVGAVLRAGQLVSRRRGADAVHRLALRRAEPGAADVPAQHLAAGSDPRLEGVRPRRACAAGRLGEGALAPADAGHHQERRRPARHLRRRDAGRDRRQDDPARAERSGVVPRRPLSRRSEAQRAGPVVHVVVRRVGRAEPRALQPRPRDGAAARSPTSSGR